MNISEVIDILQEIKKDCGDLRCVVQVNRPNKDIEANPVDFYSAREFLSSVTTDKQYVFFANPDSKEYWAMREKYF